jgi:chromosome segregation ATPase
MLVNIEDMSAEELFELANKKKRAEEDAAQRAKAQERINEVRKRREQLTREYEQALAANDKEMQALQKRREELITKHQAALAVIDNTLTELELDSRDPEPPPARKAAPAPAPEKPAPARRVAEKSGVLDELGDVVMDIMSSRASISESLLKEQLRSRGHSSSELGKVLEQLVRDGKLVSRGYGNYAPAKKQR